MGEHWIVQAEKNFFNAGVASCATGPWRTDAENAPRDGTLVLMARYHVRRPLASLVWWNDVGMCWRVLLHETKVLNFTPTHWAELRLPESEGE